MRLSVAFICFTCVLAGSASAQTAILKIRGSVSTDGFGWSVADAGDVDGDGIPDLVVGSWNDGTNGAAAGRAQVRSGRDGSLLREHFGDAAGDAFGFNVAGAKDLDLDGVGDYVVTAPQWTPTGPLNSGLGYARAYSGATGVKLFEWSGTQTDSFFGLTLGPVGDVDADGHADVAIAAFYQDTTAVDAGECYVYSGADGSLMWSYAGDEPYDSPGNAIDTLGDVDGDGHDDFALGIFGDDLNGTQRGRVLVISGQTLTTLYEYWGGLDDTFGTSVANAGDVDADGTNDLIVGVSNEGTGLVPGEAHVYSGATGAEIHCLSGRANGDEFGFAVDGLGDLDGDGFGDFLVTSFPTADWTSREFVGACTIYSGRRASVLAEVSTGIVNDFFGLVAGAMGDLDGDGLREWFVGAPGSAFDLPTQPGTVFVYTMKDCPASWTNYGAGWPGTLGVPAFTAANPPVLGESITLDLGNSRGASTAGMLLLGFAQANIPTSAGGTILVGTPWIVVPLAIPASGLSLQDTLPSDVLLCGLELDLQVLEADPGASHGLSFTAGLQLLLGG
jgi:hypothetical protein